MSKTCPTCKRKLPRVYFSEQKELLDWVMQQPSGTWFSVYDVPREVRIRGGRIDRTRDGLNDLVDAGNLIKQRMPGHHPAIPPHGGTLMYFRLAGLP